MMMYSSIDYFLLLIFLSCLESQGCHLITSSSLLSLVFLAVGLLLILFCYFPPDSPCSELLSRKLSEHLSLRGRHFGMALVEQPGDDSWKVVCAVCGEMALVFAIIVYVSFLLCLFYCFSPFFHYIFL